MVTIRTVVTIRPAISGRTYETRRHKRAPMSGNSKHSKTI